MLAIFLGAPSADHGHHPNRPDSTAGRSVFADQGATTATATEMANGTIWVRGAQIRADADKLVMNQKPDNHLESEPRILSPMAPAH